MPPTDRHSTTAPPSRRETVLVLTDGSVRATRVAEWELVFTAASSVTVHRIDVMECLDSGVIVRRYAPGRESTIDVLHGVPHEAIRDYAVTLAVDHIIICVRERAQSARTLLGDTLTRVTRRTTIPTMIVEQPAEPHDSQRQHEQSDHYNALSVNVPIYSDGGSYDTKW